MSPGDFVITANWAPHDHGNPSNKPMLWLDVLDAPTINFYETSFGEDFESPTQETKRQNGDSLSFYGSGVLPDGTAANKRTPVINYTYARTRPIIERMHGGRRRRQEPRRARALRQSEHRRPGAADHGRQSGDAAERFSRRAVPRDRQHRVRLRRRATARRMSTARCSNGGRTTCSWCRRGSATRTRPSSNRCCSRFPTARRRKRSASGGRGGRATRPSPPGLTRGSIRPRRRNGLPRSSPAMTLGRRYFSIDSSTNACRSASLMTPLSQVVSSRSICPAPLRSIETMPRFTELASLVHS